MRAVSKCQLSIAALTMTLATAALPQQTAQIDFESVGRGRPLIADANEYDVTGATYRGGFFSTRSGPYIFWGGVGRRGP